MREFVLRPSKDGPLRSWTVEKLGVPLYLGAGRHTVRIVGRTPGARIDGFELAPALAGVTAPRWAALRSQLVQGLCIRWACRSINHCKRSGDK